MIHTLLNHELWYDVGCQYSKAVRAAGATEPMSIEDLRRVEGWIKVPGNVRLTQQQPDSRCHLIGLTGTGRAPSAVCFYPDRVISGICSRAFLVLRGRRRVGCYTDAERYDGRL